MTTSSCHHSRPTRSMKHGNASYYGIAIFLAVLLTWLTPLECRAVNAYVYLDGAREALYITDLKFHYYRDYLGKDEIVVVLPEERKYSSYSLRDLRRMEFLGIPGYRNLLPTFSLRIYLRQTAHWREVILMPLQKLSGSRSGRKWEVDMGHVEESMEGTLPVREIRMDEGNR